MQFGNKIAAAYRAVYQSLVWEGRAIAALRVRKDEVKYFQYMGKKNKLEERVQGLNHLEALAFEIGARVALYVPMSHYEKEVAQNQNL